MGEAKTKMGDIVEMEAWVGRTHATEDGDKSRGVAFFRPLKTHGRGLREPKFKPPS